MPPALDSTRELLLDAAREMAQTRGYNAFSFRDLARQVDIRSASIHYHFPTKAHLGKELVIRYREQLAEQLRLVDARTTDPLERLRRLVEVLRKSSRKGTRMCLCGMFGAEFITLPGMVQDEVRALFAACERWISTVLADGRAAGALHFDGDPDDAAQGVFASLQGGMLAACTFQDEARFNRAADLVVASLRSDR